MPAVNPLTCWGLGLTEDQATQIRACLDDDVVLRLFSENSLPDAKAVPPGAGITPAEYARGHLCPVEAEKDAPFLLWLSGEPGKNFLARGQEHPLIADIPRVLLLREGYCLADVEPACNTGVCDLLSPPLKPERLREVIYRARQSRDIHLDMLCMTREILLERELLERKSEILSFVSHFLSSSADGADLPRLLQNAFDGCAKLLPVRALHAVLWDRGEDGRVSATPYVAAEEKSPAHEQWRELLLEHARRVAGNNMTVSVGHRLPLARQTDGWAESPPSRGCLLWLPLEVAEGTGNGARRQTIGALALQTEMERPLGRDQASILQTVLWHLAASVRGLQNLRKAQRLADCDELTGVHNRRHFEQRFSYEITRAARYTQPLSMLMMDIDNFKCINDTKGHQAGDAVLRQMGELLGTSFRATDYCARYGGEEFAVLLPHTDITGAGVLAERIRATVEARPFLLDTGERMAVTISIGIASIEKGGEKKSQRLLGEADEALYAAKAAGRNLCRSFDELSPLDRAANYT